MAPTVGEKTLVNETTHFQVFPRQTIRAAISILEAVVLQGVFDGEWQHINELIHEATALLKDFSKPWPLTVEHGSKLWQWIFDLVFSAKRILSNLTSMEELGYYLKPLADFYDSAVTLDANGVLLSAELISFQKQLGLYESFERVKGKKKTSKRKIWLDRHPISGLNGIAKQEFDCLVLASEWKSELFPPESARGKTWLECRDKMLANPSALVKEVVSINWDIDWPAVMVEESEKPRDEVKAESNVLPSSSESDNIDIDPSPCVSNGSNLATSKHTAINDVVNDTLPPPSINRRYVVILEAGVEKFEVEFDPKNVNGPQNRVLAATEKLWSWLVDREMDKKVRLADAVALAEDILRLHEDNV